MKKSNCILGLPHKIVHIKGFGYLCKRCGKTLQHCSGKCSGLISVDKTK
jgi:hypothetical protein